MYKIAIITIGDEICIGQITNTNASWIATKCTELGAMVITHSAIRDDKEALISDLNRLIPQSNMIIITGGLGPTHDDITKSVLTEYFKDELILNSQIADNLKARFEKMGRVFTERNLSLAFIPSKAIPLDNQIGTAPGLLFEVNNTKIIALPGVPSEMKYIMENSVLLIVKDEIIRNNYEVNLYKIINVAGIAESDLADLIGDTNEFLDGNSLAFLPSYKGIRLRIGVFAKDFDSGFNEIKRIEGILFKKIGNYIFSTGETTLSKKIGELLTIRKKTVAVAESCTGGMLGAEFTSNPGSSIYFVGGCIVYSNEAKEKILKVDKELLLTKGAVSKEVVEQMAENVRILFNTDYGVGITGIAGPDGGTTEKPVGTVWVAVSSNSLILSKKFVFTQDRAVNRERSVGAALTMLHQLIMDDN